MHKPLSIRARMLWVISILLVLFSGTAGWVIDRNFVNSSFKALQARLSVQVMGLIAATEETKAGFQVRYPLQDIRLFEEGSGIYAGFFQNNGNDTWLSRSAMDESGLFIKHLEQGELQVAVRTVSLAMGGFGALGSSQVLEVFTLGLGVVWDEHRKQETAYTFAVAQDMTMFYAEVARFRKVLWGGLASIATLSLLFQGVVLRWGLSPLRQAEKEVRAIQSGTQANMQQIYPMELSALTQNINNLLHTQQEQLNRHRHALDDLAHSLKTPLAVIQLASEASPQMTHNDLPLKKLWQEQGRRMQDIIDHQLRRAATAGHMPLSAPTAIAPIAQRIVKSLAKIYGDKPPVFEVQIEAALCFYGDQGDLYELLGNLLDNACKWCRNDVRLSIERIKPAQGEPFMLRIQVEDDGPGISDALKQAATQRGTHLENPYSGQGIGLAVVHDIMAAFNGKMRIEDSSLGGAKVSLLFPEAG